MTVSISVDGSDVIRALNRIKRSAQGPAMQRGLYAGALLAEGSIKRLTPVDTGNLRSSVKAEEVSSQEARIATGVEYAPHVEYGTSKMSAQPYMRPGLENNRDAIVQAVAAALRQEIGG